MTPQSRTRTAVWVAIVAAVALLAGGYAWRRSRLLTLDPRTYEQAVSTFYRALASLQVGLLDDARTGFAKVTELAPPEPAGWANLALSEIRLGDFDAALKSVQQAGAVDPRNSEIEFLFGQLETSRGRLDEGIAHFRRAIALDSRALRPRGTFAQELERAGGADADSRAQEVNEGLLALVPGDLVDPDRSRTPGREARGREAAAGLGEPSRRGPGRLARCCCRTIPDAAAGGIRWKLCRGGKGHASSEERAGPRPSVSRGARANQSSVGRDRRALHALRAAAITLSQTGSGRRVD